MDFGGGGHTFAAGCTIKKPIAIAFDKLLKDENIVRKAYPVSADMYVDARTDFSRARADKNATVLENMNSLDSKTQEALKKYGVKPNERGVYYNADSDVSKKFGKSREFHPICGIFRPSLSGILLISPFKMLNPSTPGVSSLLSKNNWSPRQIPKKGISLLTTSCITGTKP